MQHTIGKLAALALVVGVGVAVVIHAQRSIQTDDPNAEQTSAAATADENPLADDDLADVDMFTSTAELSGSSKSDRSDRELTGSKASRKTATDRKIVRTSAGRDDDPLADATLDDEPLPAARPAKRSAKTAQTADDPFATGDDDESDRPRQKTATRGTRSDDDLLDLVDDPPPTSKRSARTTAAKTPAAGNSRGAVLSLDESDRDDVPATPRKTAAKSPARTGPRLAAGTDEPADDLDIGDPPVTSPLRDDDTEIPLAQRTETLGTDDETDSPSLNDEAPPRTLTDDDEEASPSKLRGRNPATTDDFEPLDRSSPPADDPLEEITPRSPARSERRPADSDLESDPPRATPRLNYNPAELGNSIEVDDPPAATPKPKGPAPQVRIEKLAPKSAVLGKPMVYHIHVHNTGTVPAYQVVVEDVIPPEFEIDGSIPQAQLKNDHMIWKLGMLPAGKDKKIAVRVIPRAEGTIGGVATVNFSADDDLPKKPKAELKFDVSAPKQAALGTPVEFNFHITNVGQVPAKSVTIRDVLPAGLRHPDGDDLEYNLGDLSAGQSQDVKLVLTAAQAGPTTNRVVVTAEGDVAEESEVQLEVLGPMLQVTRQGPKRMIPGKTAVFSNQVTNPGTKEMTDVTMIEKIPPGMEYVSAGDGGVYDETKRSVFWSLKHMQAGESRTVSITLRTVSRGAQISVIRAFDAFGSTGETSATTKVSGAPAISIELAEVPAVVEPGETVRIPVRVVNRGSDTATHVRLLLTVNHQLKIVSADGPTSHKERKLEPAESDSGNTVELQYAPIEKLDPKGDAIFEITVKASAIGSGKYELQAICDQLPEPIRRQEVISIVND
ncbi:MAG: DUF11 domain-containing protein [Planctomycetes bacterium]|nr:DUF11 domain-containing protein [Planctomycetota bacterium]